MLVNPEAEYPIQLNCAERHTNSRPRHRFSPNSFANGMDRGNISAVTNFCLGDK